MKECSDCFLVVLGVEDCCLVCVIACLRLLVLGNSTGIIFQPKICSNINYQLIMLSLTRHISSHHLNEDVIVLLCIILPNAFFTLFSLLGTMGNLLCVLAHCSGRGEEIITGDKSHIFLLEQGNVAQVSESHFEATERPKKNCRRLRDARADSQTRYSLNHEQTYLRISVQGLAKVQFPGCVIPPPNHLWPRGPVRATLESKF